MLGTKANIIIHILKLNALMIKSTEHILVLCKELSLTLL